ncbi:MAG: hypothetical protein IPM22_19280 [Betaproteobacteria bacterium]|nr:hypothetical protein [Betaproteobacteria bacterium]
MQRRNEPAKFVLKPVVIAVALAAGAAWAAPTPNQMPGAGQFVAGSLASTVQVNGGAPLLLNATITGLANGSRIDVYGKIVLHWGVGGLLDPGNPHGFNLGSNATLYFGGGIAGNPPPAVLNIDVSGNPSQIYGNLISTAAPWVGCVACIDAPAIFLANANGIVVGPGGRIVAPTGVGLIGADMTGATSINEFIGNNGWVIPAAPSYGNSYVSFGTIPATGNVTIAGAINGDFLVNKSAPYILVAGNNVDVLNTGNLFGRIVRLSAGLAPQASFANVDGLSNQTVNRLWNVDTGGSVACCYVGAGLGTLNVVSAGSVVNEGSISQDSTGYIMLGAGGSVRSGVAGSPDTQVGLFADDQIYVDAYSNAGAVELHNVVASYAANQSLRRLMVNWFSAQSVPAFRPDVIIDALTPGAQPSSIATTEWVQIYGGNVSVLSTINHRTSAEGGVQGDWQLVIDASEAVDIAADVGAGASVFVDSGGPLTISGNVLSNTIGGVINSSIYITNNGAGAPTTISGNLTALGTGGSYTETRVVTNGPTTISGNLAANNNVFVRNYGTGAGNHTTISGDIAAGQVVTVLNGLSPANNPLAISGNITAADNVAIDNLGASAGNTTTISGSVTSTGGNVYVTHYGLPTGMLTVSGSLNAFYDVTMFSDGHAQLGGVGIFAGDDIFATVQGTSLMVDGPWTAGDYLNITSPLALAKLNPAGVLTAPTIAFAGLSFTGVNSSWLPYVDASEKPAAQLVSNSVNALLLGSMNAPIAGNTNWPLNSMDIAPLFTLAPVNVSVSAVGGGFQAVNLRVLGDAIVDSGVTTTPFIRCR